MAAWITGGVVLLLAGLIASLGCAFSAPGHLGKPVSNFDGEVFTNPWLKDKPGFVDFLKWVTDRERGPWKEFEPLPPGPRPPARVEGPELRVTLVNHATVLLQTEGLNILTDPIWSERASPVGWVGPRRVVSPGIRFEDLPRIDVVLLSHNHYDHLDLPTLKDLHRVHAPLVLAGLGVTRLLEAHGIGPARELDWWQAVRLSPRVRATFVPAQHFSGRGLFDRDRTLWGGFVLETPAGPVYFAGDTGFGPHFERIRERFGPMRLAILPIGAFRPEWFMRYAHTSPAEAVEAHRILASRQSLAIHHGTFPLADDGQDEPVAELERELERLGLAREVFWTPPLGEGRLVPALGPSLAEPGAAQGARTQS